MPAMGGRSTTTKRKGVMAQNIQVRCIRKSNRSEPHERIQGIGGVNADGSRWYLTEADAIAYIENGTYQFYVSVGGKSVWVIVATRLGRKYLKTEADGEAPNNLLSLPECP
jgi:hypothetical protein